MIAVESRIEHHDSLVATPEPSPDGSLVTVKVYTRHSHTCPKRERPDWARCNCVKWLYVYRNGNAKLPAQKRAVGKGPNKKRAKSATPSIRSNNCKRQLESKTDGRNLHVDVAVAVEQFLHEVARLNRAEATRAKYKLTLSRLLNWCVAQEIPVSLMSQLDVANLRRWIHSWTGAPTTLYNQHQRVIAFFNFCIEQDG
ncbi:MAG TPA: hypothetical protein VN872_13525 [Candidatus Acidoferrum sp.]|nr:hypothetical protein [Candidatus Acidoferrum sp.]